MKIINVSKPHSWLQWPVTLLGCKDPKLHITAKFFGVATLDVDYIRELTEANRWMKIWQSTPRLLRYSWKHERFGADHVFEFVEYPAYMDNTHAMFPLIKDSPRAWKPHITVPKDYWNAVRATMASPDDRELGIGPLELCLGHP